MNISDAAYDNLRWLRSEYDAAFPDDPADTIWIAEGYRLAADGTTGPLRIAVGFLRKSDMTAAARERTQIVRGLKCVAVGSNETQDIVGRSTLDYSPDRAYFLREGDGV